MARPPRLVETRPTGNGRARGLVSSRRSGRRVEARTYAAPPDLADLVEALWIGRWDLRGQEPHVTELLSDPCVHVVVERGASRVVGVWTRRWTRELAGLGHVRAVKLLPGGIRGLVGAPAHTLTDRITPLAEVLPIDVARLEAEVMGPDDDHEAFGPLLAVLRALRRPRDPQIELVAKLARAASSDPTLTSVEALASRGGIGVRSLQRLFRDYVGCSPKQLIRRARLQEAALAIERGEAPSLARLAADLGYTDQAHLTRDFKAAVGKTPRAFERIARDV